MSSLPTGVVTFLFTDVVGSTASWEERPDWMAEQLEIHDRVLRDAIGSHHGFVFATGGDSFSAAFDRPSLALTAAAAAQQGLLAECELAVRMGLHTGQAIERDHNYFGPALNRTARLMSVGHGGQVLVSAVTRRLAHDDFAFVDLGDHRLADVAQPQAVSQLLIEGLAVSFPSLRSAVATTNLPLLAEVVGREIDIAEVSEQLTKSRLVTLTGTGGIGKTTLALHVAHLLQNSLKDGSWLADLTTLPPGAGREAIGEVVGAMDERFDDAQSLADRSMLIVLDNCEHVLAGAVGYVHEVLSVAPAVSVLATSREPLAVVGEKVRPVAPLSTDPSSAQASAIDLFMTRAAESGTALDPSGRPQVGTICNALGGLPLAIELAAARTAVLSIDQIENRLADRLGLLRGGRGGAEHHRTIEATIAWSYDLLDEPTARLMRFLSVFEGGFDLDVADGAFDDENVGDVVDGLADLVRKSLIRKARERFAMLESIRQFAAARAAEAGEDQSAAAGHFRYFADWAHERYWRTDTIDLDRHELEWISDNVPNLEAAVRWGADRSSTGAAEIAVLLGARRAALQGGSRAGHNDWYAPLLSHLDDIEPQLRLSVMHGSAALALGAGDAERGLQLLLSATELHRESGLLTRSGGNAFNDLGIMAVRGGDWDEAERWWREGIEFQQRIGQVNPRLVANHSVYLFDVGGDPGAALELVEQARREEPDSVAWRSAALPIREADYRLRVGELETARRIATEFLIKQREANLGFQMQVDALHLLALCAARDSDSLAAANLALEAVEIEIEHGFDIGWRGPTALDLAEVLTSLGEPSLAGRVLGEFRAAYPVMFPGRLEELEDLEQRIEGMVPLDSGDAEEPIAEAVVASLSRFLGEE